MSDIEFLSYPLVASWRARYSLTKGKQDWLN